MRIWHIIDVIAELKACGLELNDIDRMLEYVNNIFPQDQPLMNGFVQHVAT